jgi:hypothetical protein
LADGKKSLQEIMNQLSLPEREFAKLLEPLLREEFVYIGMPHTPLPESSEPSRALPFFGKKAVAVVALLLIVGLGGFLIYRKYSSAATEEIPIKVDGSPFASVEIQDKKGNRVGGGQTPFLIPLKKGVYVFVFRYEDQKSEVPVKVGKDTARVVRKEFWNPEKTRALLEKYQ